MDISLNRKELLESIYHDEDSPASFGGINRLYRAARLRDHTIKLGDVKNWLKSSNTYTLHRPLRIKFQRNRIIVPRINYQWEIDLVDLGHLSRQNNQYRYLLTTIDILSKFARVRPLKSKRPEDVLVALKEIISEARPERIRSDKGGEFKNALFKSYFEKQDIIYFTTRNEDIKCAVIERFNKSLKNRMFRFFTAKNSQRYIDILPRLVSSYNRSINRGTKLRPVDVTKRLKKKLFEIFMGLIPSERHYFLK